MLDVQHSVEFPMRACVLVVGLLYLSAAQASADLSAVNAAKAAAEGKVTLVDIRTPGEWRETGYPKGAKRLNLQVGETAFREQLLAMVNGDKDAPVALICRTGNRTTAAQRSLQNAGFTRVFNVKEGMAGSAAGPGWLKQGLPVTTCTVEC